MNKKIILLFCLFIPLLCIAQSDLKRYYSYDAAGNRVLRKVINMISDSTHFVLDEFDIESDPSFSPLSSNEDPDYYLETLDRVQIKIYPNPATEKITLEIAGWQNLQVGTFYLYSISGQLLQKHPVHSLATEVSLANLAKGVYILKVFINDEVEDWKIVKQ